MSVAYRTQLACRIYTSMAYKMNFRWHTKGTKFDVYILIGKQKNTYVTRKGLITILYYGHSQCPPSVNFICKGPQNTFYREYVNSFPFRFS